MNKSNKINGNVQFMAKCYHAIGCITGNTVDDSGRPLFVLDFQGADGSRNAVSIQMDKARDFIELVQSTLDDLEAGMN